MMINARRLPVVLMIAMPMLRLWPSRPSAWPRVIRVVAERFLTPSEIAVNETKSSSVITSEDTSHGFHLIGPGTSTSRFPSGDADIRAKFEAKSRAIIRMFEGLRGWAQPAWARCGSQDVRAAASREASGE
jgi:hypothetical protein